MSQTTMQTSSWSRGAAALALATALLAPLGSASFARAASDPLASGTTKLTLDKGFVKLLKQHGVKILPLGPATAKAGAITLPVSGGQMDPTTGNGTIDHEGSLLFKSAKHSLPLRDLVAKTESSPLIAKVGGGQLKIATSNKRSTVRDGFGTAFSAKSLKLTQKVAVRLDKKLRIGRALKEGQPIGQLLSRTQPLTITVLATNRVSLELTSAMAAKLSEHFVSVNPISPAEHPGPFTFPIIPLGAIAPNASLGTLRSGGSLEFLKLGFGQIFLHEFWLGLGERTATAELDVEPSPPNSGKHPQTPILELNMAAATVSADPAARTISVSGATATLNSILARSFNEAFAEGKEDFRAGEALGMLSFTAQGQ